MNSSTRSCRNDGISALKFEVQDYLEKQTGYCFYYVYLYLRPETFRTTLVYRYRQVLGGVQNLFTRGCPGGGAQGPLM